MSAFPYYLWDHWYPLCQSRALAEGRPVSITVMDTRLVAFRSGGRVSVLRDRCPHLGASLALGTLRDGCLKCPFHGWRFDQSGQCVGIPSLGLEHGAAQIRVDAYPTREAGGMVWAYLAERPSAEPPGDPVPDELLDEGWHPTWIETVWPVNYTRFMENMFDRVHVPYVHKRTIGRGLPEAPITPQITPVPDGFDVDNAMLQFRLPNRVRLDLGPQLLNYLWGVPIGPEETRIFILTLRRFGRSRLFDPLWTVFNRRIIEEDRRVVLSQEPRYVPLEPGREMLTRSDGAARTYRRMLAHLGAEPAPDAPAADGEPDRSCSA